MGFGNGSYAKIWKINREEKYADVSLSISRKNKDSGEYETEWSDNFTRFIGKANDKLKDVKEGDRIKLISTDVTNKYSKEKNVTYTNYKVFDFETLSGNTNGNESKGKKTHSVIDDDELPF